MLSVVSCSMTSTPSKAKCMARLESTYRCFVNQALSQKSFLLAIRCCVYKGRGISWHTSLAVAQDYPAA